jgi:hypothetical protein
MVCVLALAFAAAATPARAQEVWVPPTQQQDLGGLETSSNGFWPVSVIGAVRFAWAIPNDLQTFQSAKIALIAGAADNTSSLGVFVCAAKNADLANASCTSAVSSHSFTAILNQLVEVEIGPDLTSRIGTPGANYLAVLAFTTPNTTTDHIVGLRFSYAAKAPTGVATLAANTFTGTQTAPAFVGNGSALTNLPFPPGAATLGSNTFSATQTITGDLTLSGNITRGATPLLHTLGASGNLGVGVGALAAVTSGTGNVAVGAGAGMSGTTGSNNIYLGANVQGTAGESNTMYLGQQGVQTRTFVGGVRNVTTTNPDAMPVVIDSAGQLGTAPTSLATLGANTFTGTQTAPAFSGDGSALTNLPFPTGAATLGANVFSGSQVAPAFIGSGAGLFNLPFPQNAATLGANTFTATQRIDAGNLDLDVSSAGAGNITKNGSLFAHNSGTNNTFFGVTAGNTTLTGSGNVGVGVSALHGDTIGNFNTAMGSSALLANTTGAQNTANGWLSLANNIVGNLNTAVGYAALIASSGSNNVALGGNAGSASTTGTNNIYIGANVNGVSGESNTMYLGKVGMQTRTVIAGVRGITTGNNDAIPVVVDSTGQLGTISSSIRFKEDIHDMANASARLLQLRPVTFRYTQPYGNGTKPIQFGLVAEEVAAVFPELAVRGADGRVETVHYETLNVLLLNELQKQQQRIDALEQKLNDLLARVPPQP